MEPTREQLEAVKNAMLSMTELTFPLISQKTGIKKRLVCNAVRVLIREGFLYARQLNRDMIGVWMSPVPDDQEPLILRSMQLQKIPTKRPKKTKKERAQRRQWIREAGRFEDAQRVSDWIAANPGKLRSLPPGKGKFIVLN